MDFYIYRLVLCYLFLGIFSSALAQGPADCPFLPVYPQNQELEDAFSKKGREFAFDSAAVIRAVFNPAIIPADLDKRIIPIQNREEKPLVWGVQLPTFQKVWLPECFLARWTTESDEEIVILDGNSIYVYIRHLMKSSLQGEDRVKEIASRLFPEDRFAKRKENYKNQAFKSQHGDADITTGRYVYVGDDAGEEELLGGVYLHFTYILGEDFAVFCLNKAFDYGAPAGVSYPRFSCGSLLYSTIGGPTDPEELKKAQEVIRLNEERKKKEDLQLKRHYAKIREAMQNSDLRTGFLRRLINGEIPKEDIFIVNNNLSNYYLQPVQFYYGEQLPKISKEEQAILTESIWSNNPQKIVYALKYILALADHAESAAIPDFLPELMRLAYNPEFHQKCLQNTELAYWLWKILSRIGDNHTLEGFKLHFNMNLTLSPNEEENLRRKKQRLLDELKEYQKTLEQNVVRNQEARRRRSLNLAPIDDYNLLRCPFYRPKEDEFYIPLPLNAKSTRSNSRILTSLEGWFVEDCVLLGVAGDFVRLHRVRDDVELTIPIRRLSLDDQKYLRSPKAKADIRENLKRLKRKKAEK